MLCEVLTAAAKLIIVLQVAQGPVAELDASDRARDIDAKVWFNAQPVRLFEPPNIALIHFWSVRSAEEPKFSNLLNRLQERYADRRLLIIGLTEDDRKQAERFIRRRSAKYKIGAESESQRRYQVRDLPAFFLINLKEQRILWHKEGKSITPEDVTQAVSAYLGQADGADRSARLAQEEESDRSLIQARAANAEEALAGSVNELLTGPVERAIEPEDLAPITDFYEIHLPSDPDGPDAVSEIQARALALGFGDESGLGKLAASGRLSEEARLEVQDRLLSALSEDPSPNVRMWGAVSLGRFVGRPGDNELLSSLKQLQKSEADEMVKGRLQEAIDRIDPSAPAAIKQSLNRPSAYGLRRELANNAEKASTRWADANGYLKTVGGKPTAQLLSEYWSMPDGSTDSERENAVIKRNAAIGEVHARITKLTATEQVNVHADLVRMLSNESDFATRRDLAITLWDLAKTSKNCAPQIVNELQAHLNVETDAHLVKPTITLILDDLRSNK